MPQSLKDNFFLLNQNGIIDKALKEEMEKMVGFRNVAVLHYEAINPEILKSIVQHHLKDIKEFYTVLLQYLK